ncbi:hypothetical protein M3Y97_00890300 [Aphelenchoides bicaudatus]|nr:hypothetical protein M3Y97_00890300 [Aphelenchoides bicaudatus]
MLSFGWPLKKPPKPQIFILLICLLCGQLNLVESVCPNGCSCSEKSVVCTSLKEHKLIFRCGGDSLFPQQQQSAKRQLTLEAFTGRIDFTNLLIIHSCDHVIVPNDTFVGVDIVEQLKFIGIQKLTLHAHAFRGIRISPKQFVIQDSHIPILHSHSFEGLKYLDHFWIRNVTIGDIHKMAFGRLTNVQYVYLRNVAIGKIQAGAFAHMQNISYFYARDKVLIKSMSDFAFIGSRIEELFFENSHVHATDLSLTGLYADRIHILDSKWNNLKVMTIRRIPQQKVKELLIQNTTINRIVFALLYNYTNVIVDKCKILHIQPAPTIVPQNISSILFTQSVLTHWNSHALTSAYNIGKIEWSYTSIEVIHHHAMFSSEIGKLNFHNVHITTLSSRAFEQNNIQEMSLVESSVKLFGKMFLSKSEIQNLTIDRLETSVLEEGAFSKLNSSLISILASKFDQFPPMLFHESFIDELNIKKCSFNSYAPTDAFHGLHANRLLVQDCDFNCSVSACEENSLLLQPSIHASIAWRFEENHCKSDQTTTEGAAEKAKICVQEHEFLQRPGVACRRRLEIEECVCTDGTLDIVYVLNTNASVLILGDCHRLRIYQSEQANSSLQILYLYRIGSLEIVSVDRSLSQLHVLHSHVHFSKPYSFSNMNLHEVSFVGSFLDNMAPLTFAWSTIDFFNVNTSTLRFIAGNAFANAQIQTVEFYQANAISVGQLFEKAREVRIESSFVHEVRGLENVTNLCLRNNSINCRCLLTHGNSASLMGSICDDPFAQCIEPRTSGPISEFTIQHVDCHSSWENAQSGSYTNSLLLNKASSLFDASFLLILAFLIALTCNNYNNLISLNPSYLSSICHT